MPQLKLFLLGPPRAELDGSPVDISRRKVLALLIYLATSGQPHSRDSLATLFYPDHSQSRARAYLRRDLAILNTSLEGDWLKADRDTVKLGNDLWLDVAHFRQLLNQVQTHDHLSETLCADCLSRLSEAVALYTDEFLAGFTLRDCAEFDDWQFFQTESLRQELALALEHLVQSYQTQGKAEAAILHARRWLALDPLHEPAQRQLMQLYDQAGQQAAALRQYEEYVNLLEEELGIPPEEETATLYEAIKAKRMLKPFIKIDQGSLPIKAESRRKEKANKKDRQPAPAPAPTDRPQRYELLEKIGQGGFATVYRALDTELGRAVALKELSSHLLADARWVRRFRREARVIARLDHPRIVTIYDVDHQGKASIVMRLVEGPNLADLLASRGPLPWAEVVEIIKAVAEGLDYAHSRSILHRDLKPANILIDPERGPLLTDFGFAKLVGENSLSHSENVVGTPHYIAPEVWEGQVATPQTDIYALGCIMYEMLTGKKLFAGETPPAVMTAHFQPLKLQESWPEGTPPGVVDVLAKALAKQPEDRYASAVDLVEALNLLTGDRTPAEPDKFSGTSPAPQPASTAGPAPHYHLPQQPTSFVGRETELTKIGQLLREEPACRLLTLIGPGGIGKTRLATEAARAATFAHGIWFVPLAPLSSASSLVLTIADELGLSFHGADDPKQQLVDYLRPKELLLVLDNFEHLLPAPVDGQTTPPLAGNAAATAIVAELLEQAPHIKILVTSRERLNLSAEWLFPLQGLTIPERDDVHNIETYSAVQLFIQRARQVQPQLGWHPLERASIGRICRLVGGMPLGIELAAAWVSVLPVIEIPQEIERNLDFLAVSMRDLPERHRNMRAIFDQSWKLLTESEQCVFRRLSVFRGGFTRAAVEAVCGETAWSSADLKLTESGDLQLAHRQFDVLQALSGLLNKSFLQQTTAELRSEAQREGRYEVHELMRQYGAAKLMEIPEDEQQSRDRHAEYYLHFLAQQELRMKGREQRRAHEQVAQELENIRLGWQWAAEQGQTDLLLQAIEAFWLFHVERNLFHEAMSISINTMETLDTSLRKIGKPASPPHLILGILFVIRGGILMRLGNYSEATTYLERGLTVLRAVEGGERWVALALNFKGANYQLLGAYDKAHRCLVESIELSQQVDDRWLTAYSLNDLGMVTHLRADTAEAQRLSQQSLTIFSGLDDRRGMAFVFNNLGFFAFQLGDYAEADWLYRESLNLRQVNRDQWGIAQVLISLGMVACAQDDHQTAYRNLLEAIRTALEVRAWPVLLDALVELATLLANKDELAQACDLLRASLHHPALSKHTQQKAEQLLANLLGLTSPQPMAVLSEEEAAQNLNALITKLLDEP